MSSRLQVLRWRSWALATGRDPSGAALFVHTLAWLLVLGLPGATIVQPKTGPSAFKLWLSLGGDRAVCAFQGAVLVLVVVAVFRLSVSQRVTRWCLLVVAALEVGFAITLVTALWRSVTAWDVALFAVLALWAHNDLDLE